MRAALFDSVGRPLRIDTIGDPEPAGDEVLLKVASCGICGSDLHMTEDPKSFGIGQGVVLGHEFAGEVAAAYRIPTLTRDVFLDHEQTEEFVDQQFELLIKRAKENGSAIGIGHPHKVTVDYLEKRLPELDEQGIAVATVSGVWAMRNGNRPMFAEGEKRAIRPALAKQE